MLRVTSQNGTFSVCIKNTKITNCFSSQKFLHAQDLYVLKVFSGKFQWVWMFRFEDILKLVVTVWFVPLDCATDLTFLAHKYQLPFSFLCTQVVKSLMKVFNSHSFLRKSPRPLSKYFVFIATSSVKSNWNVSEKSSIDSKYWLKNFFCDPHKRILLRILGLQDHVQCCYTSNI